MYRDSVGGITEVDLGFGWWGLAGGAICEVFAEIGGRASIEKSVAIFASLLGLSWTCDCFRAATLAFWVSDCILWDQGIPHSHRLGGVSAQYNSEVGDFG
jgi:hypothetical protein